MCSLCCSAEVETLEVELVRQTQLAEAKLLRQVAAKAKAAVSKKTRAEEASLICQAEAELDAAGDCCIEFRRQLEDCGDSQTAAHVGVHSFFSSLPLSLSPLLSCLSFLCSAS